LVIKRRPGWKKKFVGIINLDEDAYESTLEE